MSHSLFLTLGGENHALLYAYFGGVCATSAPFSRRCCGDSWRHPPCNVPFSTITKRQIEHSEIPPLFRKKFRLFSSSIGFGGHDYFFVFNSSVTNYSFATDISVPAYIDQALLVSIIYVRTEWRATEPILVPRGTLKPIAQQATRHHQQRTVALYSLRSRLYFSSTADSISSSSAPPDEVRAPPQEGNIYTFHGCR